MDAAHTPARDARRCARPGCGDLAAATLAFRYDRQQAWLTTLVVDKTPATYDLCGPCADRTAPPRGWDLVDERPELGQRAVVGDVHDEVRNTIAAALRGEVPVPAPDTGMTATAVVEESVVVEEPAEAVAVAAATESVASHASEPTIHTVAIARTPVVAAVAEAPAPALRVVAAAEDDDHETPRRRRRGPVEVLIQGLPAVEAPLLAETIVPPTRADLAPAASHAPTTHRLLPADANEPAAPAPAPAQAPDEGHRPGSPTRPARVPRPVPAAGRTATDMPLAFDTVPDRLVSLGAGSGDDGQRTSESSGRG